MNRVKTGAPHEPLSPEQVARLRPIAREQRWLLLCILAYLGLAMIFSSVMTRGIEIPFSLVRVAIVLVGCGSVLFGVKLAHRLFGVAGALVCGLLLMSPMVASVIL